ncbi:MAG: AMP-binding protein [Halobacteriales archaeon]
MDTLWELLARERRSDRIACRLGADARVYDYDRFLTTACQAGNYLRHLGVREGVAVGIADDRIPETLLAALGTGLLGAAAWVDPPPGADLRAMIAPAGEFDERDAGGGQQLVAYGGSVADPSIERFEEGLWSENPTMPPERPGPDEAVLTDGNRGYSQTDLLGAAERFVDEAGITPETEVAVRASMGEPGVFVGMLGTIGGSGAIVFPDSADDVYDVALGDGPESRIVDPGCLVS